MSDCVWLLRHGDTEWTEAERHTGLRDVSLSEGGREQARRAGRALAGRQFEFVLVSPQARALDTSRLAGFGSQAEICDKLVEWDYGEYEGLTDAETRERDPGWDLFSDGAPGGESPQQVAERVESLIELIGTRPGTGLLVGHGKLLRALGAVWIGCGVHGGRALPLDPAALAILERESSAGSLLRLWNYAPGDLSA